MSIRIALAGNPNCGKTTMFNNLTGATQYVGNWPGVTVEKKEGKLKGKKDVIITDLPGIYSLSPYTLEEVVSRNYLINEHPDVVIDLVDASNIERNLYLTTQLLETGIPTIIALNMIDIVHKKGDKIDVKELSNRLGCPVVETSALKGTGLKEVVNLAISMADNKTQAPLVGTFDKKIEDCLNNIASTLLNDISPSQQRWFAVKLFERDEKVLEQLKLSDAKKKQLEEMVQALEKELDDDSESIITNERYTYIEKLVSACVHKKKSGMTTSDKIDRVVTNRWLALPIFAVVMFLVYYVSVSWLGAIGTDWANDGVFGDGWFLGPGYNAYSEAVEEYEAAAEEAEAAGTELVLEEPDPHDFGIWVPGIPVLVEAGLERLGTADWLNSLILDGIIGGVGAVLGFVPQMLLLFLLLSILEDVGYMARIAFIMDRIFRKFGLSGKSFIPMLISSGCGVPGVMASRTIENEKDRRMTIIVTTFIPCGAKLPIIALIGGALFGGAPWVAPAMYFMGVAVVIISGIILKKTKLFAGDPAPFVMELPQYHIPSPKTVLMHMWERAKAFIKKAGTIIFLACGVIWFLSSFGFTNGGFGMVEEGQSLLANIGNFIAPIFAPLGFGNWRAAVATFTGLVAKENIVATFGILFGLGEVAEDNPELLMQLSTIFTSVSAMAFMVFNLLCAPCFAAIGAIRREMSSAKWTWIAIGYQTILAYVVALIVNQLGSVIFLGASFGVGTVIALLLLAGLLYLLFRSYKPKNVTPNPVSTKA